MKWVIRLFGFCVAVLLCYCVTLVVCFRAAVTNPSYRPIFTRLITPFQLLPYTRERVHFINAGLDLVSTASPLRSSFEQKSNLLSDGITAADIDVLQKSWPHLIQQFHTLCQLYPQEPDYIKSRLPSSLPQLCAALDPNQPSMQAAAEMIQNLPAVLGFDHPMHYLALFQNNMELRPTGGFMGSYADIWLNHGKLETFHIQDIYVPDGQIKGYVKEPAPIKKYLFNDNHPGWRLRDANWHPDFPESTKAIDWFFQEGKLPPANGFVAVNLFPIIDILKQTSGIYLPDYNLTITADNFYQQAQRHAEENFFPGSTQKGDFLRSVGTALLDKFRTDPNAASILPSILISALQQKHVMAYIPSLNLPLWHAAGWDGSLHTYSTDYLMLNEANLGSIKSNCCIDRSLSDKVSITPTAISHHLILYFKNHNASVPKPPDKWGGGYKNFLRVITPPQAESFRISIDGQNLAAKDILSETFTSGYLATGFLVLTEGGHESKIEITYSIPLDRPLTEYQLYFQKQSGVFEWPIAMSINQQEFFNVVQTDTTYEVRL